jgi:hypothetical protein
LPEATKGRKWETKLVATELTHNHKVYVGFELKAV